MEVPRPPVSPATPPLRSSRGRTLARIVSPRRGTDAAAATASVPRQSTFARLKARRTTAVLPVQEQRVPTTRGKSLDTESSSSKTRKSVKSTSSTSSAAPVPYRNVLSKRSPKSSRASTRLKLRAMGCTQSKTQVEAVASAKLEKKELRTLENRRHVPVKDETVQIPQNLTVPETTQKHAPRTGRKIWNATARRLSDTHIRPQARIMEEQTMKTRPPRSKTLFSRAIPNVFKVTESAREVPSSSISTSPNAKASSMSSPGTLRTESLAVDDVNSLDLSSSVSSPRRFTLARGRLTSMLSHSKRLPSPREYDEDNEKGETECTESIEPPQPSSRRRSLLPSFTVRRSRAAVKISDNVSLLTSRAPYGSEMQRLKLKALSLTPGLQLLPQSDTDCFARDVLRCGVNALQAEVLDMNAMILAMEEHRMSLTHDVVGRFFDWFRYFLEYLDRYMLLDENILFGYAESRSKMRGDMRRSSRMKLRGQLQKAMHDISCAQDLFRINLPAGEKLGLLVERVQNATMLTVDYTTRFMGALVPLYSEFATRGELDRLRREVIRYIMAQGGGEEDLAMYTRWMGTRELSRWRLRYLVRHYNAYRTWAQDIYDEHLEISCEFADQLCEENTDSQVTMEAEEWRETLRRAQIGMAKFKRGE